MLDPVLALHHDHVDDRLLGDLLGHGAKQPLFEETPFWGANHDLVKIFRSGQDVADGVLTGLDLQFDGGPIQIQLLGKILTAILDEFFI